jgi:polar amino acid transport system ATP-binding protein
MIKFHGVHKWFKKLHVLNDIHLHVKQGEVVVVCGPSGSGKSTLIRTINQLEPIDKGSLVVDGMDLSDRKTDINRLRAEVGFVFQQFNLYPHLSVINNITLAPIKIRKTAKKEAEEQAMQLLERVGLAEKRDAHPAQLSGGQQQRVAIARALVNEPAIILADEPTGNLDTTTSGEIMALFQGLNRQGITIIMVTHEPDIAAFAGRQLVFRDGLIVDDRTTETGNREPETGRA